MSNICQGRKDRGTHDTVLRVTELPLCAIVAQRCQSGPVGLRRVLRKETACAGRWEPHSALTERLSFGRIGHLEENGDRAGSKRHAVCYAHARHRQLDARKRSHGKG